MATKLAISIQKLYFLVWNFNGFNILTLVYTFIELVAHICDQYSGTKTLILIHLQRTEIGMLGHLSEPSVTCIVIKKVKNFAKKFK